MKVHLATGKDPQRRSPMGSAACGAVKVFVVDAAGSIRTRDEGVDDHLYLKGARTPTAQHVALGARIRGLQPHSEVVKVVSALILPKYGCQSSSSCIIKDKATG